MDEHLFPGCGWSVFGLERFEDFIVEELVFAWEHYEDAGRESVADGVAADGLFAGLGHLILKTAVGLFERGWSL